jgi:molybdate transport system substrate-binding protein
MDVQILSGGAAQGVVKALQQAYRDETGAGIAGTFGAVGAMKESCWPARRATC